MNDLALIGFKNHKRMNQLSMSFFGFSYAVGVIAGTLFYRAGIHPLLDLVNKSASNIEALFIPTSGVPAMMEPMVYGLIVVYIVFSVLEYGVSPYFRRKVFPTFQIQYYENSIVCKGRFSTLDFEYIRDKMTSTRTGYALTDCIPEGIDGAIAAIPACDVTHDELTRSSYISRALQRQGWKIEH